MKITIKNRFTSEVIHEGEFVSVYAAMADALKLNKSLCGANLRDADLCGANLGGANLGGANLRDADLCGANLRDADLCDADLRGADLCGANLCDANLCDANLRDADLRDADLRGADLCGANLCDAKNLSPLQQSRFSIVPCSGDFIGWKKCLSGVLVKLLISDGVARSNSTGRKCRCEQAEVVEVIGAEKGVSRYDKKVVYIKGETVKCDTWNEDRWVECGGGIHFFITRLEAEAYEV